jgi:hypothetical protein
MAHGGHSRPDVTFKDPAHSPIFVTMEPTIVALKPSGFTHRKGELELGVDALIVRHPKLHNPLELPLSTIAKVLIGPGPEVCRGTTIPAGIDPKGATLVLVLATPVKVWLRGALGREVSEIALAAADPAHAAIALSRLRVEPPAPPTPEQLRNARPLRVVLGVVAPLLIVATVMFGIQYGVQQVFPAPASADAKAAEELADAERTEGRSRLPHVPSVAGAISWRARAEDGSLLYAWQRDDRLSVRVDTSPQRCSGGSWREWWSTADRPGIKVEADGSFFDRQHGVAPISSGGVDVADSTVEGRVRRGIITLIFHSRDDYRGAYYNGICLRSERFSARHSG